MKLLEAQFDGDKIEIPEELVGHRPCKVRILVEDIRDLGVSDLVKTSGSVKDFVRKNKNLLNEEQLRDRLAELRKDRDEWDAD